MYDQILFPTSGSEPAGSVLEYILQIAAEHEERSTSSIS